MATNATQARTFGLFATAAVALASLLGAVGSTAQAQEGDPNAEVFRNHREAVQIRCDNCLHDEAKGRSADAPAPMAPVPFAQGTSCPICAGSGFFKTSVDWTAGFYFAEGYGVPSKATLRNYRDAASDQERAKILGGQAKQDSVRAASLDAWRHAAKLAAMVRLNGQERLGPDRVETLSAELVGMENVAGEWDTTHATPFFKLTVKVPLWGVKGVVANLLEQARTGAEESRQQRPAFDWRKGAAGGKDEGGKDEGGKDEGGKDEGGKDEGGKDEGGKDEGGKDEGGKDEGGKDEGGKDEGGKDESDKPAEKPADEIKGIIIDARAVKKHQGPVNAALFPTIVTEAAKDAAAEGEQVKLETVHDVSDTDPQAASAKGVASYVESDTPFERIAAIYRKRGWLVVRAPAESEELAGLGVFAQVKFGGKKDKKKLTFKIKAKDMEGPQRANIVISAQDARKLKLTDDQTGVLKNCKIIVIAGGDIAGKRGALPDPDCRTARAR